MNQNWRVGSLFGIPLYIDSSWFIVLLLITVINAGEISTNQFNGATNLISWAAGLTIALLMFTSVLLHELGHSLMAIGQGIQVNSITLFLFGGVAAIERESKTPLGALLVAIAGPLVSFSLFGLFSLLSNYLPPQSLVEYITSDLALINLILGVFNLIPGLPLDGGQVLKAIVWQVKGDRLEGIAFAAASGRLIGWTGIIFGLFLFLVTGEIGALWLSFIGWFILRNANAYQRLTILQKTLLELMAAEVMTRDFRVVDANLTLGQFTQEYLLSDPGTPLPYYGASEGRYRGKLEISDLQKNRSLWMGNYHPKGDSPPPLGNSLGERKNPLSGSNSGSRKPQSAPNYGDFPRWCGSGSD